MLTPCSNEGLANDSTSSFMVKALCGVDWFPRLHPLPRGAQKALIEELASQMHLYGQNRLVHLGKRTLERYLSQYRKYGLEGLRHKVRKEQGSLKAFPFETLEEAIQARLAQPELSTDSLIDILCS